MINMLINSRSRLLHGIVVICMTLSLLIGSTAFPTPVQAGVFITVNTMADNTTTDGQCTLREAIINANNNVAIHTDCATGQSSDAIYFADSLGTATIVLTATLPTITDSLFIVGDRRITINGNSRRLFMVPSSSFLSLTGLTMKNGWAPLNSPIGGAIRNAGILWVTYSTFTGNRAYASGGAIENLGGTVTIRHSTFSGNQAGLGLSDAYGGAIGNSGTLTIVNSTFHANQAIGDSSFGGALDHSSGDLNIYNSTLSENSAADAGGGIYVAGGTLNLYNTIIANNTGGDCVNASGTVANWSHHNLIEDYDILACGLLNGVNDNIVGSDPRLGALTGSPAYFALGVASPASDKGDNLICASAPVNNTSQNGLTRPQGVNCDIGSFELYFVIPAITNDPDNTGLDGQY